MATDAEHATSPARAVAFVLIATVLAIGSATVAAAQVATFQGLGFLPTTQAGGSWATSISAGGTVVAGYGLYMSGGGAQEAFSWTGGTITALGFPGGTSQSQAFGVNSNGAIIVGESGASPIIWINGTPTTLAHSTGGGQPCGAVARGVNANATALASSVIAGQDGTPGCGPGVATEWINGTEVDIFANPIAVCGTPSTGFAYGVSADGSSVVGSVAYCYHLDNSIQAAATAFIYNNNSGTPTFIDPPSSSNQISSTAYAASADGSVVVGTIDAPGTSGASQYAFRWTQAGGLVTLGNAAPSASALAVSADGSVVVGSMGSGGPAFRWTAATGVQNLQALLAVNGAGADLNGWSSLIEATGVSADGTEITGFGVGPSGTTAFIAHLPVAAAMVARNSHDFNGDGYSDILWRDTSGNMAIWEMSGSAILNENTAGLGGVPTVWSIVGQHDFNGDGYADFLWRNTSGDLAIWEMNGTAILNVNTAGLGNVPTVWSIAGTGDFNGDGYADILWRNTSTGDLAIWEMNGTTILNASTAGIGNVPLNWTVVGVGDFNGDGKADILWRNNTNGNVAIWLMNGTTLTNASTATFGNMPLTWSVAGTGDFNGDGNSDIFWEDSSGDLAIWEMNGTTVLNPNTSGVGNLSTAWSVAETGDFDGNGKSDILWRDTSGDIAIWFMNGTAIASGAGLGTIPTTLSIQGANAD